jgi:hypothetical protein
LSFALARPYAERPLWVESDGVDAP